MTYPPQPASSGTSDPSQGEQTYGAPAEPVNDKINPMAVVSLVFGLTGCLSLFGIVAGVPALKQIKQDGGRGRALAITGIILGAAVNGTAAILIVLSFALGK
ncbi:DUF4190 domain-containing protein [Actinocatenispora rupis]|uniref:DUF4190 domain-containing protein n=1 Tax=Actinocatenispora rupis TaxID=519421 RepID=A0A8J3J8P1_9ACTN|nr:DUF4190 domain-containing protein [Actinocatenispora rupis]GID12174.1 hypothetical protein Aru02nite_30630 [Actinocatenispora rupis]